MPVNTWNEVLLPAVDLALPSNRGRSDWDRFAIIEYQAYSEGDSETVASSTAGDDDPLVNVLYAVGGVANHSADLTLGGSTRE